MLIKIIHTIIVVTYNQEEYISTALDSVLVGPRRADEIIIIDDCSTDLTFKKLLSYKKKYPSIINVIRNTKNLGVTENLNKLFKIPVRGNVISILAGDDFYDKTLLDEIEKKIISSKLNPNIDAFMMLPDVANIYPDQSIQLLNNSIITKKLNASPFQIALRSKLYTQQVGTSIALYKKWTLYPKKAMDNISLYADLIQFVTNVRKCKYFIPFHTAKAFHRVGVGVTSQTQIISPQKSRYLAMKIIANEHKAILDLSDKLYIKFSMSIDSIYFSKSMLSIGQTFFYLPMAIIFDRVDKMYYFHTLNNLFIDILNNVRKSSLLILNRLIINDANKKSK